MHDRSSERIRKLFVNGDLLVVLVPTGTERKTVRDVARAVESLIDEGVSSIVAPRQILNRIKGRLQTSPVATSENWAMDDQPSVTTVAAMITPSQRCELTDVVRLGPPRILLVPEDVSDPEWPGHSMADRQYTVTLKRLMREI
jgi:hypothetical protein